MSRYSMIVKGFAFLEKKYGFEIRLSQKHGAYYYAIWTNGKVCIMVLYDEQVLDSVTIRVYDANSLGTVYDAVEFHAEFELRKGKPREKITVAAAWLQNAISSHSIEI